MKEYTVTYYLNEEQESRLRALCDDLKKQGRETAPAEMLQTIMLAGSLHDINNKLDIFERAQQRH